MILYTSLCYSFLTNAGAYNSLHCNNFQPQAAVCISWHNCIVIWTDLTLYDIKISYRTHTQIVFACTYNHYGLHACTPITFQIFSIALCCKPLLIYYGYRKNYLSTWQIQQFSFVMKWQHFINYGNYVLTLLWISLLQNVLQPACTRQPH